MPDDVDRGWAWVVLVSVFFLMVINGGVSYTTGLLFASLSDIFTEDTATVGLACSILLGLTCMTGVLGGMLAEMTSCRTATLIGSSITFIGLTSSAFITSAWQILVTYGVLTGFGLGIIFTTGAASVGFNFQKRRDFASGICLCGVGAGQAVFPLLIAILEEAYGWRGVLLLLAGIFSHAIPLAALIRPTSLEVNSLQRSNAHPPKIAAEDLREGDSCRSTRRHVYTHSVRDRLLWSGSLLMQMFHNKMFVFFNISFFTFTCAYGAMSIYLPKYYYSLGGDIQRVSLLVSLGGVMNTIARLLSGMVTQNNVDTAYTVYVGNTGLTALSALLSPVLCQSVPGQCIFAVVLGFYSNGLLPLFNSLVIDMLSLKLLPVGFGVLMFSNGLGFFLGPVGAGYLIDTYRSYTVLLVTAGGVLLISSLLGMVVGTLRGRNTEETRDNEIKKEEICLPEKISLAI